LINSLGNLGGFLAPIQRDYFKETYGGNAGLYSLSIGAILAAVLFASTALFHRAACRRFHGGAARSCTARSTSDCAQGEEAI
jgi:hypothetical protein